LHHGRCVGGFKVRYREAPADGVLKRQRQMATRQVKGLAGLPVSDKLWA
jgi:hypothetical protein